MYRLSALMSGPPQILPFIVQNIELVHVSSPTSIQQDATAVCCSRTNSAWIKRMIGLVHGTNLGLCDGSINNIEEIVRKQFRPNRGVMVIPFMSNMASVYKRSQEIAASIVNITPRMWNATTDEEHERDHMLINNAKELYSSLADFLVYVSAH
jgi:hypothetical protein